MGEEPTRAFVNISGGQIHYRTIGEGKPVILLHQTPLSSDEYVEVLPLLGQRCRAIAMDMIGFGDSYRPEENSSIEHYGRAVVEFMQALAILRATLVGHHTGAVVALEVATSFPERVEKLVLSACPYYDEARRAKLRGTPVMDGDAVRDDGTHLTSLWQRRREFYPKGRSDLLARFMADALTAGKNRIDGHVAVREYKIEEKYAKVKCSTLVTCGTDDQFCFPYLNKIAAMIPGSRAVAIPGGTVALPQQLPQQFSETILAFLSS